MEIMSNINIIENSLKFGEYFTEKDVDGLGSLLSENFSLYDPALKWIHGKEAVLKTLKEGFDAHQKVSYQTIETFQDQNTTIVKFEIIMDEKKFVGVDFMTWEGEKMTELICYYNPPETN